MGLLKQFFTIVFLIFCISHLCSADWLFYDEEEEIPLERQQELGILPGQSPGQGPSSDSNAAPPPNKYFADERWGPATPAPSQVSMSTIQKAAEMQLKRRQQEMKENEKYEQKLQREAEANAEAQRLALQKGLEIARKSQETERQNRLREAPAPGEYLADERIYKPDSPSSLADEEWIEQLEKERQEEHRQVQALMKSVKGIQAQNEQLRIQERNPPAETYNHKTHSHAQSNNRHAEHHKKPAASALVGSVDQSEPNREVSFIDKYFRLRNDCDNDYPKMNMILVPLCILLGVFYVYC